MNKPPQKFLGRKAEMQMKCVKLCAQEKKNQIKMPFQVECVFVTIAFIC